MTFKTKLKHAILRIGLPLLGLTTLASVGNSIVANADGANTLIPVKYLNIDKNYFKFDTDKGRVVQVQTFNGAKPSETTVTNDTIVGWPHNSATGVWDDSYPKYTRLHSQNVINHLGSDVYKISIPKYDTLTSNDDTSDPLVGKSTVVKVSYKDAVIYDGKNYDAVLTISNIQRYPQKYWGISNGPLNKQTKPDIFIGKTLNKGIWYDGITRANVKLTIPGIKWESGKHAYFTFNSLNGSASGTEAQDSFDPYETSTQSFLNNASFYQWASASQQRYLDIVKKRLLVTPKTPQFDMTGKWVNWDNGDYGYVYNNTGITNYFSNVQQGYVNGGGLDTHYSNNKASSDYYTHSIMFQVDGFGKTQSFTFGSGQGYGNFKFSTKIFGEKPHVDEEPKPKSSKISKSTNKMHLSKQGDTYTYTISGKYPERKLQKKWYIASVDDKEVKDIAGKTHKIKVDNWKWKADHTDDHMDITDNIDKQLSITSIKGDNINASYSGNTVSAHASYNDLIKHSEQEYKIYITVKADKLPQPDANGWHDDGPKQHGMYYIYNQADTTQVLNGTPHNYKTQKVHVGIERWMGIVHHYDFDANNAGDFNGFNIDWQGHNFQDFVNYNNKDLSTDVIYGYVNDKKEIDSKYVGYNSDGGLYQPFVQKGQITFYSPDTKSDGTMKDTYIDDKDMVTNFYMPYYTTKLRTINNMVKIDTDKNSNGLPIHIYQRNESFLYKDLDQYKNATEFVNVYEVLNNGQKVKDPSFSTNRKVSDMIASYQHGGYWWNIDGKLNNLVNPETGTGAPKAGQKINFKVETTFDPHNGQSVNGHDVTLSIIQSGSTMDTYGFISTESDFNNDSFKGKSYLSLNPVERTIAYNGASKIRELREGIRVDQQREANAKTGYGIRNDFQLSYAGWNNVNGLNVSDIMNNATALNFVFPKAFADNGLDHDSNSIKKDKDTGFKNSDSAINYNAYNNINPLNSDLDGSTTFLQDRLQQINKFDNSDLYNPSMDDNNAKATLDTFNNADGATIGAMNNARQIASDDPVNQFDETVSSFNTNYRFYQRVSNFGANLPNGVIGLASDNDPEASNKVSFDSQVADGGYRFYTPYWLSLKSSDTKDGKYPTYWERNTKKRFGANFFDVNDRRPINFYGHMYLANNSKSDQNDELSIQPLITAKQIPNGFSQSQVDWLKHYATFK